MLPLSAVARSGYIIERDGQTLAVITQVTAVAQQQTIFPVRFSAHLTHCRVLNSRQVALCLLLLIVYRDLIKKIIKQC